MVDYINTNWVDATKITKEDWERIKNRLGVLIYGEKRAKQLFG